MEKLVDMKRTAADKKAESEAWKSEPMSGEDYPYGLSIHLDQSAMEKLGLSSTDLDAGQAIMLCAECVVTSDNITTINGKTRRSMTLQLQKVALSQEKATDIVGALYGKD